MDDRPLLFSEIVKIPSEISFVDPSHARVDSDSLVRVRMFGVRMPLEYVACATHNLAWLVHNPKLDNGVQTSPGVYLRTLYNTFFGPRRLQEVAAT